MRPDRIGLFNRAGIPGRFADATLVSFSRGATQVGDDAKFKAFVEVSHWLGKFEPRRENKGLILHGRVGRGKTHLMVALLRSLILQHGVEARFVEFSRLLSMLKEGYSTGRSDTLLLGELAAVPVLGIDELGKGRLTDWELQVIDEVISRRYNGMNTTLGTSNFRPGAFTGAEPPNAASTTAATQTLGDRVGDRVYSRLRQMTGFVELGGLDFREL
jgi:DNA replication protein DnaC